MEEKSNTILSLSKLLQVTMQSFAYSTEGKLLGPIQAKVYNDMVGKNQMPSKYHFRHIKF